MSGSRPLIIAHRGGAALAPENTLQAFQLARTLKVDGVELDVRITADNEIVVIHDGLVSSGPNDLRGRAIEELTYNDLQRLNVGTDSSMVAPPLLSEVLLLGWDLSFQLMIELKSGARNAELVRETAQVIHHHSSQIGLSWGSLDAGLVGALTEAMPSMPLVGIADSMASVLAHAAHPLSVWALRQDLALTSAHEVRAKRDMPIWCWTVNDPADVSSLVEIGVSGIITDQPSLLTDALP